MACIDLVALQQRMAQQPPKPVTPVPAEPPSGTLRATTTMRAALPLKAPTARAERAEERARANALRAQIDELNAALVVANAEADRALADERLRADQLGGQVEALSAEVVRAKKQAEAVAGRAERAEADRDAERARAEALRTTIEELKAGQALMTDMHARELAATQDRLERVRDAAEGLRQASQHRAAGGGLVARLRAAWRGE
jgi:DNA repair exonuclease SbcCD ATPase subunit